ncbi:MAG: phytoene desaturase family protein [Candidatus Omnitrophica bacterium]|nr:phytoene desaturase family protein [Candidatus Omnitrophota bacterium]
MKIGRKQSGVSEEINVPQRIAIIGAGVGGLACACRLAKDGYSVDVYEKLASPGGRNNIINDQGFKFDTGPSFVLMPDFFQEVFSYCGENINDYLNLKTIDPSYKIIYPDGDCLTVHKDSNRTKNEIERIEKGSSQQFDKFIAETKNIYEVIRPLLYECVTLKSLLDPRFWFIFPQIHAFESYWQLAKKYFKSQKLCYAFTFEAMFMGVSPYQAPAFYSVITYTDHAQKIAHPLGGMYQIPLALEKMAKKFGAKFHYNCEVKDINKKNKQFSLKINGENILADTVVVNADYAYAQESLLKRKIPKFKYSCSVYLIYLGLNKKLKNLSHHNLFFADNLDKNLDEIFNQRVVSQDPSFYVHVPTVTDASLADEGKEIAYILVPVPNLENDNNKFLDYEAGIRKTVFQKINQLAGCDLESLIEVEHKFYPEDFIKRYNLKNGATFGLAHNLTQSAFMRPQNFDTLIPGLYFVGASTQPGGGLPVVIAGSRIVADLIRKKEKRAGT